MFSQLVVNGIVTGSIYVMVAVGFSLIYNAMRFFNLSHGAMFLLGAYFMYLTRTILGMNLILAILAGSTMATVVHVAVAKLIYFPLRAKKADSWIVAIASLAVAIVIQAFVGLCFGTRPVGLGGELVPRVYSFVGVRITSVEMSIAVVAFASIAVLELFLKRNKFGKAMRASVCDREVAEVVGIDTVRVDILAFTIGTWLATMAGALMALQVQLTYTMDHSMLLKAIVVAIIGINRGIPGTLFGGLFLGIIENLAVYKFQAGWRDGIALLILMVYIWAGQLTSRRRAWMAGGA